MCTFMRPLLVLAITGVANGANMVELWQVDNGGLLPGMRTFDLGVWVDPDDNWTSASIVVLLGDGVFYQHPLGGDDEPAADLLLANPELEFDTFFAAPPELFDGDQPLFADGPRWTDRGVEATWYSHLPNGGGGLHTLFRFSTDADGVRLDGAMTFQSSGGDLVDYNLCIWPTPGTAAPLLLGGMLCHRRRR